MTLEINTDDFWKELDQRVLDARTERKLFIEEITKLREQVAAQAAELTKLRLECITDFGQYVTETDRMKETIAAQAAVIESLKSALRSCYSDWNGDTQVQHFNIGLVYEALAIPTDSTQILDEVRREERERVISVIENAWFSNQLDLEFIDLKEAIRAME